MKLLIIGSGEAFDWGLGNSSSLLTSRGSPTILFDCGYQTPERLWQMNLHQSIDAAFISHTHFDHAFGIAPLLARFWEEGRKKPLTILGASTLQPFVKNLMELGMPGLYKKLPFKLEFIALPPERTISWKGYEFKTAASAHSIPNLSVRVADPRGRTIGISGDGKLTRATRALFQDVDFLLHEIYSDKPGVSVHSYFEEIQKYIHGSKIQQVAVNHIQRDRKKNVAALIAKAARKDPRWLLAVPGMEIEIA